MFERLLDYHYIPPALATLVVILGALFAWL